MYQVKYTAWRVIFSGIWEWLMYSWMQNQMSMTGVKKPIHIRSESLVRKLIQNRSWSEIQSLILNGITTQNTETLYWFTGWSFWRILHQEAPTYAVTCLKIPSPMYAMINYFKMSNLFFLFLKCE